jgi:hypothetical protein
VSTNPAITAEKDRIVGAVAGSTGTIFLKFLPPRPTAIKKMITTGIHATRSYLEESSEPEHELVAVYAYRWRIFQPQNEMSNDTTAIITIPRLLGVR